MAHELSPFERKPDQYTGFPTGVKNMSEAAHPHRGGGSSKFDGEGACVNTLVGGVGVGGLPSKRKPFC